MKRLVNKTLTWAALALIALGSPFIMPAEASHRVGAWHGVPRSGHALYYTDNAYERIGRIRVRQGYIPYVRRDVAGYTAVTDCAMIGRIAYISLNNGPVRRYQILDCSHPSHVRWHVREGRVAEVNERAMRRDGCVWPSGETKGRCRATLHDIRRN